MGIAGKAVFAVVVVFAFCASAAPARERAQTDSRVANFLIVY